MFLYLGFTVSSSRAVAVAIFRSHGVGNVHDSGDNRLHIDPRCKNSQMFQHSHGLPLQWNIVFKVI